MEDILLTLRRIASSLPNKQKKITNYILKNPSEAKSINLKELCQLCETTEPVVFALCQKLEVGSFLELKTQIALSLGAKLGSKTQDISSDFSDADLLNLKDSKKKAVTLASHYQESIADSLNSLNLVEFEKALKLLKKAKKVLLLGVGVSGNVGHLMQQSFIRTGLQINWTHDPNLFITYMQQMDSNDVCLILSQTGSQKDILYAIETTHALKIKSILISSNPKKQIKEKADIFLTTGPYHQNVKTHVSAVSKIALPVLFVLDLLAISLMTAPKNSFLKDSNSTAAFNQKRLI